MSSETDRSNGFLPLAPLRHAEPTAVGVWDMEHAGAVMRPLTSTGEAVDQLVLARLHGQPLAILHVEAPPGGESLPRLTAAAWQTGRDAVMAHVTAHGCLPAPENHEELAMMLQAGGGPRRDCSAPPQPHGRAAVVVCTTGADQATLVRCLRSLAGMDAGDYQIVVVDNRPSSPPTRALIDGFISPVPIRYVAEPEPGLARARNSGIAACDADFIAFTDDDVIVDRSWLAWLLEPFSQARVSAVTGLVMPLALESVAEKRFEQYAGFGKGVQPQTYDLSGHAAHDRFLYPYWGGMFGSGNSMAFRREALTGVGGFDQALGAGTPAAGGEDIAAFTDVILAGGQIVYQPAALCWHRHRGDEQALRTQVRNYGIGLTAVLSRYLARDPRFSRRLLGSLPAILRLALTRSQQRSIEVMPADLSRLELQGRMLGPWRYLLSRATARRGAGGAGSCGRAATFRPAGGERRRSGGASPVAGTLHTEIDQTGAQTRT